MNAPLSAITEGMQQMLMYQEQLIGTQENRGLITSDKAAQLNGSEEGDADSLRKGELNESDLSYEDEAPAKFTDKMLRSYAAQLNMGACRRSRMSLIKKIIKERTLIDAAKEELEKEKGQIKECQAKLSRAKDSWRRQQRLHHRSEKSKSLLQEASVKINKKAAILNARVEEAKKARNWIAERQKKLLVLERAMLSEGKKFSSEGQEEDILEMLSKQLDEDLSTLEVSSDPSSALSSISDRPKFKSHRKLKESHFIPSHGSDKRSMLYAQPPSFPPHYFFDPQLAFYQVRPPNPPAIYFNDEINDAYSRAIHGPVRLGHWSAPINSSENTTERVLKHNLDLKAASALDAKRQLREITNRLAATKEAYENHAK